MIEREIERRETEKFGGKSFFLCLARVFFSPSKKCIHEINVIAELDQWNQDGILP